MSKKGNKKAKVQAFTGKMKGEPLDPELQRKIAEREKRLAREAAQDGLKLPFYGTQDAIARGFAKSYCHNDGGFEAHLERLRERHKNAPATHLSTKPSIAAHVEAPVGLRRLYFAYGSNLDPAQMHWRCRHATALYKHNLPGFKLAFKRYADIVPAGENDYVPGVIWLISKEDEAWLDKFEGVSAGSYTKHTFKFFTPKNNWRDVLYYKKTAEEIEAPSSKYLDKIATGYRRFKLDMDKLVEAADHAIGVGQ